MIAKKMGYNLEVDIHDMTVIEARKELISLISKCDKNTKEIDIVHGFHGGQALLNLVRKELKHPRIVKRILSMNQGVTTLVIQPEKITT